MIPRAAHHSSTERTSKWKQATQYVYIYIYTSQPRAHSAGFCFSSWPGSPSLSLTGVYQKKQQQNNETAANQQITQMKNQFPDWMCGTIFFPQGPIIFQTTVPPFQKNIFTPQSNVRRWHADAFREKLPELCYRPVTPDWDLNSWPKKLRAASRTIGIIRHQERLHLQWVIPEEPSTRLVQKPENTSIAKRQHNFSKLQKSLFLQNEENGGKNSTVFPPDIQQRERSPKPVWCRCFGISLHRLYAGSRWTVLLIEHEEKTLRTDVSRVHRCQKKGGGEAAFRRIRIRVQSSIKFWPSRTSELSFPELNCVERTEVRRPKKKSTCSRQRNEQNSLQVDVQKMFLEFL